MRHLLIGVLFIKIVRKNPKKRDLKNFNHFFLLRFGNHLFTDYQKKRKGIRENILKL